MIIYRIQNRLDGRMYIGQTKRSLAERVKEHMERASAVGKDMNRLGRENFDVSVLDVVETQKAADEAERYWIEFYNTVNTGYNTLIGGKPTKAEMRIIANIPKKPQKPRRKRPPKLPKVKRFDEKEAREFREAQIAETKAREKARKAKVVRMRSVRKLPLNDDQITIANILAYVGGE